MDHLKPNTKTSMKKSLLVFTQMGEPSTTVLLDLLITLWNLCHLELQVGGMCKEHGAKGTEFATFN